MKLSSSNHDGSALSRFLRHPLYFNIFLVLLVAIALIALYTQARFFLVSSNTPTNPSVDGLGAAGDASSPSLLGDHRIEQTLTEAHRLFELAAPPRRKIKRFKTASVFPALAQEHAANIGYASEAAVAPSAVAMLTMEHDHGDDEEEGSNISGAPTPAALAAQVSAKKNAQAKRMSAKVYAKMMKAIEDKGTRLVDVKP